MAFSIIIPTYHEAKNIPELVDAIAAVDFGNNLFEVILVDDDSQDGTIEIVHQLSGRYPWLTLISRTKPRSLSHSILDGLSHAHHPLVIIMDADLSHPPAIIPNMLTLLADPKVDMVIGSRYVDGGSCDEAWPLPRRILSKSAAWIATTLLSLKITDPLSGFMAFRKDPCLPEGTLQPTSWKIGLEVMIKCRHQTIREVPIRFSKRRHGTSKLTFKVSYDCLRHIFGLVRYKISDKLL